VIFANFSRNLSLYEMSEFLPLSKISYDIIYLTDIQTVSLNKKAKQPSKTTRLLV